MIYQLYILYPYCGLAVIIFVCTLVYIPIYTDLYGFMYPFVDMIYSFHWETLTNRDWSSIHYSSMMETSSCIPSLVPRMRRYVGILWRLYTHVFMYTDLSINSGDYHTDDDSFVPGWDCWNMLDKKWEHVVPEQRTLISFKVWTC